MDGGAPDDRPVGELFGRLADDARAYARAEIGLVRATATAKADAIRLPLLLGAGALLFLMAGVVVLCMTVALALATLIGPLAGGLVATLLAFAVAGGLGFLARLKLGERP